jgi:hypothetical protein
MGKYDTKIRYLAKKAFSLQWGIAQKTVIIKRFEK